MMRRIPRSAVAPALASRYLEKGHGFHRDARHMTTLTGDFSGNGIAVLCVHAAIAYADALSILAAGRKSKSGDHQDAADFLAGSVPIRTAEDKKALKAFRALLSRKDEVSYADDIIGELGAQEMLDRLDLFAAWAEGRYAALR